MDNRDPIAQSIIYDTQEGLQDGSRAAAILKMLPRLVQEQPNLRPMQTPSGLPQTGQEVFADVGALAGQAPSGLPGDVRMGTNLGEVYARRAGLQQRGDIAANELELRRAGQADLMNVAQSNQIRDALRLAMEERRNQNSLISEGRLRDQATRLRFQQIIDAGKMVGPEGSPAYERYVKAAMAQLQDPMVLKALADPNAGMDTVFSVVNRAQRGMGMEAPMSPRAQVATGVIGGMAPQQPEQPAFPRGDFMVSPEEQAARDERAKVIRVAEANAPQGVDPAAAAAAAVRGEQVQVVSPIPPRPPRIQGDREPTKDYQKYVDQWNKDEQARFRAEQQLAISQREEASRLRKEGQEQQLARIETNDFYTKTKAELDQKIKSAEELKLHKGLPSIIGGYAGSRARTPNIFGAARDAQTIYDNVVAQQFMQALRNLKDQSKTGASGFGNLTEREGAKIQAAASKLDQKQTIESFTKHLDEYIEALREWSRLADKTYLESPFGSGRATSAPSGGGGKKTIKFGDL